MKISILTEAGGDVGLGHVVRMGHLAQILRQKGHTVIIYTNKVGCDFYQSMDIISNSFEDKKIIPETDITIVDFMNNNDDYLLALRPHTKKLVVVVGVGWTITPTTRWIADLVVYHTIKDNKLYNWTPGETILQGLEYIMMDPTFADVEVDTERQYDIVTYFGSGLNTQISDSLTTALCKSSYKIFEMGPLANLWVRSPYDTLANAKLYVGSMGMMAYEAIVARAYPMVMCRSDDHTDSANHLVDKGLATNFGLFSRPTIKTSIDTMMTLISKELKLYESGGRWKSPAYKTKPLDGKGIYRVALEILNG